MEKKMISSEIVIFILLLFDIFIISKINSYITVADIAFVLLILTNLKNIKKKIMAPNTLIATMMYFIYSILISSIMIFTNSGINLLTYLYIAKELIYLSSFFIVIKSYSKNYLFSKKIIDFVLIINLVYGIFSITTGEIAHYGIGSIVTNSPSQSGMVYIICFFISFIYYKDYKSVMYFGFILISGILVFATISRTAIAGLIVFFITFVLLNLFQKIRTRLSEKNLIIFIASLFLLFLIYLLIDFDFDFSNNYLVSSILGRFKTLFGALETRSNVTKDYYKGIIGDSTIKLLFGQGKSIPEVFTRRSTLAVDNQYTRFILEGGIVGLLLWIFMIINWLSILSKRMSQVHKFILSSLIVAYLVMGMGYEVFQVSKSGISFWFVLGILYTNNKYKILK